MTKTRTAKQYFISTNSTIKSKYGTLNKNKPEILFIRSKGRIKSNEKKKKYEEEFTAIRNCFNSAVQKSIAKRKSVFSDKYIVDIYLTDKGLLLGKSTFIKYDMFIKPLEIKPIEEYEPIIINIIDEINDSLILCLETHNMQCV